VTKRTHRDNYNIFQIPVKMSGREKQLLPDINMPLFYMVQHNYKETLQYIDISDATRNGTGYCGIVLAN